MKPSFLRAGNPLHRFLVPVLALGVQGTVSAAPLLVNFAGASNPVTNVAPGFDAEVSAAHAAGAISLDDNVWNNVQTGDVASGLMWGDGTSAAGISINLGVSPSGSNVVNFANNPGSVGLGSAATSGIYSGSRVARYGIWGGGMASQNIALGVRIDGLSAGTYDVYFTGRNTNSSNSLPASFYASAGTGDTYDFTSITNTVGVANTSSASAAYAEGVNYGVLTVTLTAGQSLYLATEGASGGEQRGFLNSLQIVAVPEPSGLVLLLGGLAGMVVRRRG